MIEDTKTAPIIVIDGPRFSGGDSFSQLLKNTYSFEYYNVTATLFQLFLKLRPEYIGKKGLAVEESFLEFLRIQIAPHPEVGTEILSMVNTSVSKNSPLVLRASSLAEYFARADKKIGFSIKLDCSDSKRVERAGATQEVEKQVMLNVLNQQDDIIKKLLQPQTAEQWPQNLHEYSLVVDTSEITAEQVFQSVMNNANFARFISEIFAKNTDTLEIRRWKCLNCWYVYEGVEQVLKCPRCGNTDPDKFEDVE